MFILKMGIPASGSLPRFLTAFSETENGDWSYDSIAFTSSIIRVIIVAENRETQIRLGEIKWQNLYIKCIKHVRRTEIRLF